jgi:tRNA(Ile)-lysidine synthase
VALLHALVSLGFGSLILCHVDHRLRGRASSGDALFVQRLAGKLGLRCVVFKSEVGKLAAGKKLSLETAARDARFECFASAAQANGCETIFLAHHADDQVETFLFNLFRGAGALGLGGMRTETTREIGGLSLQVVRPLLGVWRAEIDEYIAAHKLKFREDATNAGLGNTRSKMRHQVIPMIEQTLGREVRRAVWKTAEILRAQSDFLQSSIGIPGDELSVPELRALPDALQEVLLREWLKLKAVPDIGYELIQSIRGLLATDSARAKVNLPGGRHVRRRAKKLFVE